jgi:hypothetical protein
MLLPAEFPDTHAELYDLLQEQFGIGDYDEVVGGTLWHRARMVEIVKLKGLCARRHATIRQVSIAAWYAKEQGLAVSHSARLFAMIPDAMRTYNARVAAEKADVQAGELAAAVNAAMAAGEDEWAERLMRADGPEVGEVLDEWRKTR